MDIISGPRQCDNADVFLLYHYDFQEQNNWRKTARMAEFFPKSNCCLASSMFWFDVKLLRTRLNGLINKYKGDGIFAVDISYLCLNDVFSTVMEFYAH